MKHVPEGREEKQPGMGPRTVKEGEREQCDQQAKLCFDCSRNGEGRIWNPRIRCELSTTIMVKVLTNQVALRRCYSKLKITRIRPHRKHRKSGTREILQIMMMRSSERNGLEVSELIVQNIQMIVERQCQRSRRSRKLRYTTCNFLTDGGCAVRRNVECL